MKKIIGIALVLGAIGAGRLHAQTVSFNFSAASQPVTGWINVAGDPSHAVRSATDGTVTISSISTSNWSPYTDGNAAYDGGGMTGGTFFTAAVMLNHWFQYNPALSDYNAAVPQLKISGLNKDSVYTLKMTGSFNGSFSLSPTRYTVLGSRIYGYVDVTINSNTASGASFHNVQPDTAGHIYVYVNTVPTTQFGDISGLQIIQGRTTTSVPIVNITTPANNAGLGEDENIAVTATATESGGTISKVEFYADTTKIGESTTSPYSVNWASSNVGPYVLVANAIDANGNSNFSSINVNVESLNYFWSITGNAATGGDSNFVGTVDSNRLAFRTRNIERMSIAPNGNVGIGVDTPNAQLHTTGSVRFAGISSDSTKTRVLVSDSSGKLYYRNVSGISGRWLYGSGTQYDSADNIGIGTSNTQGYKLAVNGTAIFTKVKVKTAGTWPDYVFKKNYILPGLPELEDYIYRYRHLPGIASESEVAGGIDIAAQEAALLKKIEELTLYLIDENKQLKEQNSLLEEQNKKLQQQQQQIDELRKMIQSTKTSH